MNRRIIMAMWRPLVTLPSFALLTTTALGAVGCSDPCFGTAEGPERDQCEADEEAREAQDDADQAAKGAAAAATRCDGENLSVSGVIAKDTTWTKGSLCIFVGDVTVAEGVTLTVEKGVTIKSGANNSNDPGRFPLIVDGSLVINGASGSEVVLTDIWDDGHRGDTNNDEGQTQSRRGRWGGIQFNAKASGRIQFAEIHFAKTGIMTSGAEPTLVNIRVEDSGTAISVLPTDQVTVSDMVESTSNLWNGLVRRAGVVDRDTVWDSIGVDQVMDGDITVAENAKLTIGPGVIVKSGANNSNDPGRFPLIVEGELVIAGTKDAPVVLTDIWDDRHGRDTTGNELETQSGPGRWGGIQFGSRASGELLNVQVYYAATAITTDGAAPVIDGLRVEDSDTAVSALPTDELVVRNMEAISNRWNGVVRRGGTVNKDTTWDQEVVHIFGGDISVPQGVTLTIREGVIVKSGVNNSNDQGRYPLTVEGELIVAGSEEKPVIFTHIWDDQGGDTGINPDIAGSAGRWGGIRFQGSSAGGSISRAEIRYATNGVEIDSCSTNLEQVVFRDNDVAIAVSGTNAAPLVEGSSFVDNGVAASTDGESQLDAPGNWWGASDGPSGEGLTGSGQHISGNVFWEPPLESAPQ